MLSSAVQRPPIAMLFEPKGCERKEELDYKIDRTLLGWKAAAKGRLRASLNILTEVGISNNAVSRERGFCFRGSCRGISHCRKRSRSRGAFVRRTTATIIVTWKFRLFVSDLTASLSRQFYVQPCAYFSPLYNCLTSQITMAPGESAKPAQEALDVISNRISLALAKHDNLVKSWTAASGRPNKREKTQEELAAEDAALFKKTPTYLGVGAPVPSHFLISDAERNNKSLRAKFFPTKGLKGSKPRDNEEKAASAKRAKVEESSDEEGGRSSLGKAKKRKKTTDAPSQATEIDQKRSLQSGDILPRLKGSSDTTTTEKPITMNNDTKDSVDQNKGTSVPQPQTSKSALERRKEKKRLKKLLKKKEKKAKNV